MISQKILMTHYKNIFIRSSVCVNQTVPLILFFHPGLCVMAEAVMYCYSCVGTQPGCGLDSFYYRWHRGHMCSRNDDRCVKLIERRGSEIMVTRDCLSNLEGHRIDIPADKYEGCRQGINDFKIGQYTFNSIKEYDTKR